ncbi:MAG: DUF3667 domain-containing protein [Bacteroidota bacterium]|nr:DUF3667 domain-containing protein [Bacteroidota bacterium]
MAKIEKGTVCPNCKTRLQGENFCPECGQLNNRHKPGFGELIRDLFSTTFGFDSKFWRSLRVLFTSPGKIALDFIDGKRARYMPPVRMFILFLILSLVFNQLIDVKERGLVDMNAHDSPEGLIQIQTDSSQAPTLSFGKHYSEKKVHNAIDVFNMALENPTYSYQEVSDSLNIQTGFWTELAFHRAKRFEESGMQGLFEYLYSKLVWIMIFFLPLLAFLLKIHYPFKRDRIFVDHLVFATYMQTAFIGFLLVNQLLHLLFAWRIQGILILGFAVYLYFSLLRFYKQGKGITLLKFISLNISYFILGIFFLLLVGTVFFLIF